MYWAVPTSGTRLKVGVPVKEGFTEFVKLKQFQDTAEYNVTGFCADLFRELLVHLPFKIENPQYIPFGDPATGRSAGNYDDLLTQLEEKKYDIVVADVTILAERAQRVDFSIPYLGSEVVMLRQVKYETCNYMWIFLKPFSSDLWLTIAISCIFMGAVVRTLEHRANTQLKIGMLVWFPLASLFLKDGSFVKEMLTKRLDFNVSKIKSYASVEQYHDALFKGCHNGGVDAILDELPFIKIFLDTYGETNYKLQGSSYKTGGIGFAFPKGSALAPHISLALLNLTGSGEMHAIMSKNFGPEYSDSDYSFNSSSQVSSIGTKSLAGLFIISGSMAILALVFSAPWFHQRFSYVSTHYKLSCVYPSPSSDVIDLSVQSALEIRVECPPLLLLRTHSLCQLGAKRTVLLMMRLAKMILTPVQPDPVFTAITRSLQQI
ncbi:glutamate receptor 2.7-like isoform X1 [Apium graveolens]|uniref:glutamate receptor 2.7-like isoform X1 n=1 Tax=Apium graveolens TaxID=4045 RepID=UPI003D7BD468